MFKKIILITIITLSLTIVFYQVQSSTQKITPVSQQNDFYSQLNHAIHLAKLQTSSLQIRNFNHEVEFSSQQCQIILSSQKDPYRQIASLQEVFKTSKIKNKKVVFINLAGNHPYATLKNL